MSVLRNTVQRIAARPSRLVQVQQRRQGSSGAAFNEPTGYLFGEKPPAPGKKRVREDWESIYYWGMFGGMTLGGVLIYYKPDTSIEGWARKQAQEKLAAAGQTPSYEKTA
ncbi:uncharacterized protein JCM15063_000420 [Sporobolomyces koalae]|uniref:uncharacterized protein n=1 Tax=Sporobolomyces koalae TaxID=500713 RepID=UPI003182895D